MVCFIGSVAVVLAIRRGKQSLAFIKTDRLNVHPRQLCKLANAHYLPLGKKASISTLDPIPAIWFSIGRIKSNRSNGS